MQYLDSSETYGDNTKYLTESQAYLVLVKNDDGALA